MKVDWKRRAQGAEKRPHEEVQEHQYTYRVLGKLSAVLTKIAVAMKGPPPRDTLHDWSDLPKLVRQLKRKASR